MSIFIESFVYWYFIIDFWNGSICELLFNFDKNKSMQSYSCIYRMSINKWCPFEEIYQYSVLVHCQVEFWLELTFIRNQISIEHKAVQSIQWLIFERPDVWHSVWFHCNCLNLTLLKLRWNQILLFINADHAIFGLLLSNTIKCHAAWDVGKC